MVPLQLNSYLKMAKTMNAAIVALWALLGVHLVSCAITTPPMGTPCGPDLIPGIQRMARGVDLTQLDLTNTKGGDGFKKTLIEFTCNKDRKWMMPGTGSQKQYAWPDQVEGVNVVPSGSMTAKTAISEDTEQYKKSLEASVSTSVNALFGSFSASSSVKAAESSKFQKKSMIAETSAFTSAIEVDFAVKGTLQPSLTPSFKEFFSGPVRKYIDAQQEYDSFLDAFGTHYFDKSYLGGFLYMRTEVKEDYFNRERELEVEAKISASYEAIVKGDAQFKVKASDEMKAFLSNSSMTMQYLGGEPLTLDMDKDAPTEYVSRWTKTVFERPHLYSGSLRGIDELIENEALRAEVKKAITIRMYRAYLDSILRLMDIGKVDRSIISDVELLRRQITTAETEERFATLQAGLKRTMDLVLFSAYGKPTLASMMASWPAVMDVAQCGDAVTALCHRPITPPQAFTTDFSYAQRALAKLADRHWTDYAECRRLISEGRQLWADTYQSLEGGKICPAAVSTFSLNPYCQSPAMPQPPKMMAMKMMMMKMNMHNDSSSTAAAQSNNNNKSNALYF